MEISCRLMNEFKGILLLQAMCFQKKIFPISMKNVNIWVITFNNGNQIMLQFAQFAHQMSPDCSFEKNPISCDALKA